MTEIYLAKNHLLPEAGYGNLGMHGHPADERGRAAFWILSCIAETLCIFYKCMQVVFCGKCPLILKGSSRHDLQLYEKEAQAVRRGISVWNDIP